MYIYIYTSIHIYASIYIYTSMHAYVYEIYKDVERYLIIYMLKLNQWKKRKISYRLVC